MNVWLCVRLVNKEEWTQNMFTNGFMLKAKAADILSKSTVSYLRRTTPS